MKKLTLSLTIWLLVLSVAFAQNPIAQHYNGSKGFPRWTNQINWDNRINMAEYENGANNFEKFKNARDELAQQNGGVLYYPAGTYRFSIPDGPNDEGLMLKEGVVILGDKPESDVNAVKPGGTSIDDFKKHGMKDNMPTRFVFERFDVGPAISGLTPGDSAKIPKMWNMIGTTPANANRVGVAWVQLDYGYIYMGFDGNGWGDTWASAGAWMSNKTIFGWGKRKPDGTHPMDAAAGSPKGDMAQMGEKRFVMGVKIKNGCIPNYVINKANLDNFVMERGGWRFGARLSVSGRHVFVANNLITKPDSGAVFRYDGPSNKGLKETIYDPAKSGGIDVNKSHLSHFDNKCDVDDPNSFYTPDVVIRDNWVYNHAGKGIEVSGKWVTVQNNVNYREYYGKKDVYGTGDGEKLEGVIAISNGNYLTSEGVYDFMSRAIDYGGQNLWFDSNRWTGTGSIANDGEGILCQRHTGVEAFSVAETYNEQGNTGEKGYIAPWNTHTIGLFHGWNDVRGWVGNTPKTGDVGMDISVMQNQAGEGVKGATHAGTRDFKEADCPNEPEPSNSPFMTVKDTAGFVKISWTDVENEVAYRVDRRKENETEWTTIAYRPRQETGGKVAFSNDDIDGAPGIQTSQNYGDFSASECWDGKVRDMNPSVWHDYLAGSGKNRYRVVALTCDDQGKAFSDSLVTAVSSNEAYPLEAQVFPNPASDRLQIETGLEAGETGNLQLVGLNGQVVRRQNLEGGLQQRITLPTQDLESGMYLLRIRTSRGGQFSKKVVIR